MTATMSHNIGIRWIICKILYSNNLFSMCYSVSISVALVWHKNGPCDTISQKVPRISQGSAETHLRCGGSSMTTLRQLHCWVSQWKNILSRVTLCSASTVYTETLCLYVCLSVCLSQLGVLSKWLEGRIWFLAREFGYLQKYGYFLLHLQPCHKHRTWRFGHSTTIVASVVDLVRPTNTDIVGLTFISFRNAPSLTPGMVLLSYSLLPSSV